MKFGMNIIAYMFMYACTHIHIKKRGLSNFSRNPQLEPNKEKRAESEKRAMYLDQLNGNDIFHEPPCREHPTRQKLEPLISDYVL